MKARHVTIVVLAGVLVAGGVLLKGQLDFERDGRLVLPGLERPVRVLRDEHGTPYIFAESTPDLLRAQGFVTAQHRLFQLEAYRAIARGELAAAIGERGLASDVRMRVFGFRRNAVRHAALLSADARAFIGWFVEGVNAYVEGYPSDHHVEFSVTPFATAPWTVEDVLTLMYYVQHRQSFGYEEEVLIQMLVDRLGAERTSELTPLNVNPDRRREAWPVPLAEADAIALGTGHLPFDTRTSEERALGSNNWAVAPGRSASGAAVVANDPHVDSRVLPGVWHPVGLFSPQIRALGVALPGIPGILSGRTTHTAFGVTNAYGDVYDLYIETPDPADPDRYLDGGESRAYEREVESLRIRDADAPGGFRTDELVIRRTRRGPVLSDHGLGPGGDAVVTLRSAADAVRSPEIGIDRLLTARNAAEFDQAVASIDIFLFNFVFADDAGHIGHRASGAIPRREPGNGAYPRRPPADGHDDWPGLIPKAEMPGRLDPEAGWVATANQDTRPDDYRHYYSSLFASSYRYRRIAEVLDASRSMTVDDHWALILDTVNLQASRLRPALVEAMREDAALADLAAILEAWDGRDHADSPAPLVYQSIYGHLARATFRDELGEARALEMLSNWYFWQERFDALVATPDSHWFDDVGTPGRVETLPDVVRTAAHAARAELVERYGDDAHAWRWGDAHTIAFVSPLRRTGFGATLLGAGVHPLDGSRDTLNRAGYAFGGDYSVRFHDSFRLVVDLADSEKIVAVLAGGAVGRQFHEHQADHLPTWVRGEQLHWWFAREAVERNARHEQWLVPVAQLMRANQ